MLVKGDNSIYSLPVMSRAIGSLLLLDPALAAEQMYKPLSEISVDLRIREGYVRLAPPYFWGFP